MASQLFNIKCVKELSELPYLEAIPSQYAYNHANSLTEASASDPEDSLPVIDFSLLACSNPDKRSECIEELRKACQDWGFFMVVNHGIPETLMKGMINACNEFFNMPEEEKVWVHGKDAMDPIKYGTSFNASKDEVFLWRDFLKVIVHPSFHAPHKPQGFSELLSEFSGKGRDVAMELLKGVAESLGLENDYMHKELNLKTNYQLLVANLYPLCPQPELAIGMPPHSDHGLLTLLIDNQVGGLQIKHNQKWFNINPLPNSILVNVGDQLEIFSNGKYKSVIHRAIVNNKKTRISIGFANGPSLDTIVTPAPNLLAKTGETSAYLPMKYRDYLKVQQSNQLKEKSCLDRIKKQLK